MSMCAIPGCKRKHKGYFMGFVSGGVKRFGYVCGTHDRNYGRQNLMQSGMTLDQAIKFEGKGE